MLVVLGFILVLMVWCLICSLKDNISLCRGVRGQWSAGPGAPQLTSATWCEELTPVTAALTYITNTAITGLDVQAGGGDNVKIRGSG